MKKMIAALLVFLLLTGSACCGEEAYPLTGGWTAAENPALTEDIRALFDRAMEGLVGVDYAPVLCLGAQVVAGTNYAILCQARTVYPGAQPRWAIVYLYADLAGNAEIMNIADFDFGSLCTYGAADPVFDVFVTEDGTVYDQFVITKMHFGADHQVTAVTGHYERVVMGEDCEEPETAPGSEKTYQLAADFSAEMLESMFGEDFVFIPVTDLYNWYIDAYLGREDYDGHEWVFTCDLTEEQWDTVDVDFWFVTTQIELNDQGEIRYMRYVYVPWA